VTRIGLGIVLAALAASPLCGQALSGDPRIAVIPWQDGQTIELRSAARSSMAIVFAPGERVTGFELADPSAFDVSLAAGGDSLFVKTLSSTAQPQLTVRTHLRTYRFVFRVGPPEQAVYAVNFSFASPGGVAPLNADPGPEAQTEAQNTGKFEYRLSGDQALRPIRINDDGVRTFLVWSDDQALPAVFALSPRGEEEMVDGYMRGNVYTIDRINRTLVFRIGKQTAKAVRREAK
jgi:type IV secretion system protein VirB9